MKTTDDERYFSGILKQDMPQLIPDPGIKKRLEYVLQLKASKKPVAENSVLSFITGFFTILHPGIKTGIATGLLLIAILFSKLPDKGGYSLRNNLLLSDSSYCDTLVKDTFDSLQDLK